MCCECNTNKLYKILTITIICFSMIIFLLVMFCGNRNQEKDILSAIAVEGDNTEIGNATIKFSNNTIEVGNAIAHEPESDEITINETGIYQISYQLLGEEQIIGTFNFNAALQVNDIVLLDTLNESPILRENTTNRMTLTSTVILQLNQGDILKLVGLSIEDIIYEKARIDIEKID